MRGEVSWQSAEADVEIHLGHIAVVNRRGSQGRDNAVAFTRGRVFGFCGSHVVVPIVIWNPFQILRAIFMTLHSSFRVLKTVESFLLAVSH